MLKQIFVFILVVMIAGCGKTSGPIKDANDLQKRMGKFHQMDYKVEKMRAELSTLVREYNANQPDSLQFDITSFDTSLTLPERQLLNSMFKENKDISYNGLLKTLVKIRKEMSELQSNVMDVMEQFTNPGSLNPNENF